jgi:hypothetical protein
MSVLQRCCNQLLQGGLVRRAMEAPPLRALIQEIQDIDVFLADLTSDTHPASLLAAAINFCPDLLCATL